MSITITGGITLNGGGWTVAAAPAGNKAIFGYGNSGSHSSLTNKVSNTGIVATDTTGVGTARSYLAAAGYGADKALFGYGQDGLERSFTNLVSNTGVVATNTTGKFSSTNAIGPCFISAAG